MGRFNSILLLVREHRKMIVQALVVNLFLTIFAILPPYFTKILIDEVYPNKDHDLLHLLLILTLAATLFSRTISTLTGYFVSNLNMRLSLETGFKFYRHIGSLSFGFFDKRETGEIMSRSQDAQSSVGGMVDFINTTFMSFTTLIIFPPIIIYMNWRLAILSLIVLPFDSVISWFIARYTARKTQETAELDADAAAKRLEFVGGIRTIQSLNIEDFMFSRFKNITLNSANQKLRMHAWQNAAGLTLAILHAFGVLIYSWYGWTRILAGSLTLGSYMAFTSYVGYLSGPMKGLLSLIMDYQVLRVHIDRFLAVYETVPEIRDKGNTHAFSTPSDKISFHDVSFSYDGSMLILRDITCAIEPGQITAVVGRSGCGKTTLVQLIPRFYSPQMGDITIGDKDIRTFTLGNLRRQIGFVQQEPFLFVGTIFENIALDQLDAEQWQVEKAAEAANVHEFVKDLPQGYKTQVGERGTQLSQGQKQRIVIARALFRETPILILDEATSALDMETEKKVLQGLRESRRGQTTIVISHRLSAIQDSDFIMVVEDNTVVESGSHEILMARGQAYSRLYQ